MLSNNEEESGWTEASPLIADQTTGQLDHQPHERDTAIDSQRDIGSKRVLISIAPGILLG